MYFPPGKASNIVRGTFGRTLHGQVSPAEYERIFQPRWPDGPSGLADAPRPFLIRAAHLDGLRLTPGQPFHIDLHLFGQQPIDLFTRALASLASLKKIDTPKPIDLSLTPFTEPTTRTTIHFLTPTELHKNQTALPQFSELIARLRSRFANLATLYGDGPPDLDFHHPTTANIEGAALKFHQPTRRGSNSDHPIGGFTGTVIYTGDLTPHLPLLQAGQWIGVGRHTVWGNGHYQLIPAPSADTPPAPQTTSAEST